ncbi:synaptic vesicle glycoprotein 2C-like isoform X2 [Cimex lectularius]|uniref:Major facilitator superfamily (MFS) profile domain-containing protein n=1 Tax=Cimex lectularius TaxID=79782 RepID=A0A8I6RDY7_CIMLE|nr:synaptic vesicle glycoprotein 2C-like isoform X2 [Cimex lectularius]
MKTEAHVNVPFEAALEKAGYGKFQYLLFLLVGCSVSSMGMETIVVSIVIPAARCDFDISSKDAGYLSAFPQLGTIIGAFLWGTLADIYGRKWIYVMTMLSGGLSSLLSSFAPNFIIFMVFRIISAVGLAGILSVCLAYLAEFQPIKLKEKAVSWMEFWWSVGIILSPCLAWAIIPTNLRFESEYFNFASWNLYVATNASVMIMLGFIAMGFPESPKYYEDIGEREKAIEVLRYVYSVNTGCHQSFFMCDLMEEKGISVISTNNNPQLAKPKRTFQSIFYDMKTQTKLLFVKPHFLNISLVGIISFGVTGVYYTYMLWFPELFSRFNTFEHQHPGQTTSMCEVASIFVETTNKCRNEVDPEIFKNSVIIGLSSIPTSLWLSMCINRLGCKFFLLFCMGVAGLSCLALYFVTSSFQNLILSCFLGAFASISTMAMFCSLVDLFPSQICAMANGVCLSLGKVGTLVASLFFGYLIDYNCAIPIFLFATIMFCCAVLAWFLPLKKRPMTDE